MKKNDKSLAEVMARFDFLVDSFEEGSHPEEVRREFLSELDAFLEADCSHEKIVKLAGMAGCFRHYQKMVKHGVELDIKAIAERSSATFVWQNLKGFISRGADINFLIDCIGPAVYGLEDFYYDLTVGEQVAKRLFGYGADPEVVFDLLEVWLFNTIEKGALFEKLNMFVENGLDREFVKRWLEEQLAENACDILYYAFDEGSTANVQLVNTYGIDLTPYAYKYNDEYGSFPEGYDSYEIECGFEDEEEEEDEET